MFDSVEQWIAQARKAAREYIDACKEVELAQAKAAVALGRTIEAYRFPEELPVPTRFDSYSVQEIDQVNYGEDLTLELALAGKTSEGSAHWLVSEVATLMTRLPQCWEKVTRNQAPLWQARSIARACIALDEGQCAQLDEMVAPSLGMVHSRRLNSVVAAAIRVVDPDYARRIAKRAERGVRTGGDEFDPLTGWVSARLDRADAIYLDATVQYLADILATQGDVGTVDERRAKGLGILANPAQAIQMVGVHTTRGMNPIPVTVADKQVFVEVAKTLAPVFTPRTQVYVHLCADTLGDPEAVARIEKIGPVLAEQISKITQASRVRVTPVLHMNDTTIAVDAYEIPTQIREQVLLRQPHDCFPWSPTESRHLDLDHTIPYQPGVLGQTNPANLSPLSRKAHRAKTHAGWTLTQPSPGVYNWLSPAGQEAQVDQTGTHPPPSRE